ncbi:glucose-6-phosphate isomerase [Caproiciproducens sp. NJN-50]|uniref:glucose-6-phosphate isomerase n=1 Tax=Caproiciproducens sp. NJN-50 TaxID=2507162 RepID=UPI000FFE2DEC|nr:glucose-6-phosphate isomerase [Caproiciproducens sp. NJN-50]QAT49119.1 glucose-6-phosphate isomerase [Caproiciproducens sp. NJN-50]
MLRFNFENAVDFIGKAKVDSYIESNKNLLQQLFKEKEEDPERVFGWFDVEKWTAPDLVNQIKRKAGEIQEKADAFVLVGVGGSNNGARAVVEALAKNSKVEVVYAGNNLSSIRVHELLEKLKGKSVYIDVIAKNFETLEPGLSFRILRRFLREQHGENFSERIVATGTQGSSLNRLADENGYLFLPFPADIGGRYSVLSPVGLLPVAAAGIDIDQMILGAREMELEIKKAPFHNNPAVTYAAVRSCLEKQGFAMEFLSFFEPDLECFAKWWVQLFAESEGKDHEGLYPVACSFSEDLHSVGQYIQNGKRDLSELFLQVEAVEQDYVVKPDDRFKDGFDYLDGKTVKEINDIAFRATVKAHIDGGIPCSVITLPKLTPYYFGQLFYFFQFACYLSGTFIGINPFDQPGVEAYKNEMFYNLKSR